MSAARREWLTASAAALAAASAALAGRHWWETPLAQGPREVPPLPSARAAGSRPLNVLLVMSDQERFDLPAALPLPGHERLREEGTRFTQFHVNTTPCTPSRSTFYFGRHTQHTGMIVNLGVHPAPQLPRRMPSLGDYFRANGYRTAYKGKWQLSAVPSPTAQAAGRHEDTRDALEPFGFADFNRDGDPQGSTWTGYKFDAQIAADAARWLTDEAPRGDEPWLLAVNFVNPHDVMFLATSAAQNHSRRHRDYLAPLAAAPLDAHYGARWELPLPANHLDDLSRKPWAQRNHQRFCDMAFGRMDPGEAAWQVYQDYYFNCIRDVDRHLLTVLQALDRSGQAGRTVVVYTSDHGEMAGAHGLRQRGPFMYQENTRVPFIVRHPDVKPGRQTAALGSAVDLIPTLLTLAGCDAAQVARQYPQLAGVSLAAAVAQPEARTARDERGVLFNGNTWQDMDVDFAAALIERGVPADRHLPLRAMAAGLPRRPRRDQPTLFRGIHTGRHKFARYFKPTEHHRPTDWETLTHHNSLELYDLRDDPGELNNLAHAPEWMRGLVSDLNARLQALLDQEVGSDLGEALPGPTFLRRL
ncbi:MAG: sulfatase-like hydrolase/transferase [Rubrivivax sp.]|nr:sulfatase-like hydrolase/transferase [Rubrivivax sp.]